MLKKIFSILITFLCFNLFAQNQAPTPPMGWMTWNYFWDRIHEKDIREMADAMVESGMVKAGYNYLFIDDGWQGGRDNKNNLIPDPTKFPSGMKALVDYIHSKGLKVGIYSNAAPLTCGGYTASLHFEEQDAKKFAEWEIDYLKYDYCDAPEDAITAQIRYKAMSDALKKSGRNIALGICEWGGRKPWLWASEVGGVLWRTTFDVRDKWRCLTPIPPDNKNSVGHGIIDIYDATTDLYPFAGPNRWNDCDMLIVGLYGSKGPSSLKGGVGCNDTEYQTQMSLWSMMSSPLAASNDIRKMNEETKRILLNPEIIAINQDVLGKQAVRKIHGDKIDVLTKELSNGDVAVAILNRGDSDMNYTLNFIDVGLKGNVAVRDIWSHKDLGVLAQINQNIKAHETLVLRLKASQMTVQGGKTKK
jgi:alpha-galactosidase